MLGANSNQVPLPDKGMGTGTTTFRRASEGVRVAFWATVRRKISKLTCNINGLQIRYERCDQAVVMFDWAGTVECSQPI